MKTVWPLASLRTTIVVIATLMVISGLGVVSLFADNLPVLMVLSNYTLVSVGLNAGVNIKTGPIAGKILVGFNSTVDGSGNNVCSTPGACTATLGTPLQVDQSGTVSGTIGVNNPPPSITMVPPSVGMNAFDEANALSNLVAGFTPTQTFSSLPNGTIIGNGGLNVINVTGDSKNPTLTFQGTANDFFVINLPTLSENNPMTLNGVNPSHILWNFVGTASGNVFSTSGTGVEFGTFLATNQFVTKSFQLSNLNEIGALWNTSGSIQFMSNSQIPVSAPFTPPAPVSTPEPESLLTLGIAVAAILFVRKRIADTN
jgi:hypothetical protein